jgi:uncharacterized protein YbjT (DUF2867 family)
VHILVVGATGGSGRAATTALLRRGHTVTAFARSADQLGAAPGLRTVRGDVTVPDDLETALAGTDAVVVTLGISEPAPLVRLRGARHTPDDVRSRGTSAIVAAMRQAGLRRLVVQTSFGLGETRAALPLTMRAVFRVLLAPQIADHERQEHVVRESGLDWTLVRPVNLHDGPAQPDAHVAEAGTVVSMHVTRATVGEVLADVLDQPRTVRQALAVSAPRRPARRSAATRETAPGRR